MYLKQNCSIFSCMHVHTYMFQRALRDVILFLSLSPYGRPSTGWLWFFLLVKQCIRSYCFFCCSYQPTIQTQAKNLPSSDTKEAQQNLQ